MNFVESKTTVDPDKFWKTYSGRYEQAAGKFNVKLILAQG